MPRLPAARLPGLLVSLSLLGLLGFECPGNGVVVWIGTPGEGAVVESFEFAVVVGLAPQADVATLEVRLNGEDVTDRFTLGAGVATADLVPGAPLRDANRLEVRVDDDAGSPQLETRDFVYGPPKARVQRIANEGQLLPGPAAQGRVGDFLLDNAVAGFVVQDVAKRDLRAVSAFGGNLIDAVRKDAAGQGPGAGLDHFGELQPMANIETVLNAQFAEIVNDGQDGTAAILRVSGPDDLWDYLNPSAFVAQFGVGFPASADDVDQAVFGTTEYVLEPGVPWVRITTTWEDTDGASGDVSMYVGDQVNGWGELDTWIPGFGVGEVQATAGTDEPVKLSYVPQGQALGASYGLLPIEFPNLFDFTSTSFSDSGVTVVLHSHFIPIILAVGTPPTFVVPEGGAASHTRYFIAGTGDGGSIVDAANQILGLSRGTLRGCVTVDGAPAGAGVAVSVSASLAVVPDSLTAVYRTDEEGCWGGSLPPGPYRVAARASGTPYQGGGPLPVWNPVSVQADAETVQHIDLPATGRVRVTITDESDAPVPARVTVVGDDGTAQPATLHNTGLGSFLLGAFEDAGHLVNDPADASDDERYGKDPLPFGVSRVEFAGADGVVDFPLQPGDYRIAVSRGTEYSLVELDVTVEAGALTALPARIARVLDTTGFVSSDYHVHMARSPDSWIALGERVLSFAGEGTDNIIATDHDAHTPLADTIAELGLGAFVHSSVGEEITTSDYGHFNAYPLDVDPDRPSGGSTDWAGPAPPGEDFPSLGNFVLEPRAIYELVGASNGSPEVAVQVNHIDSHFGPLRIDTGVVPPTSFLDAAGRAAFRLDPAGGELFHPFDGLELWNGADRSAQRAFLERRIGVWMNHLNQGIAITAIGDSDTHTLLNLESAGARTWTPAPSDAPAAIDDDGIGAAIRRGRAVGGQGLYVQARLAADSTGQSTGFGLADPLIAVTGSGPARQAPGLTTSDGEVYLDVVVQGPLWAPYDVIEVYVNATTQPVGGSPATAYGAVPTLTLEAGRDFAVDEVDPYAPESIPGARRLETRHRVTLGGLVEDSWVVVVAKGSEAMLPMFPVYPRDLDSSQNVDLVTGAPDIAKLRSLTAMESGVRALGFTNALWVDVDGDGTFTSGP